MTRTFTFILPTINIWFNLWTLITQDPSYGTVTVNVLGGVINLPDNGFSYHPFEPSNVKVLKYQSQNALTNVNNGGAVISKSSDPSNQSGADMLSGSWDFTESPTGIISLKEQYFRTSIAGAGINVEIDC